ncbi:MAG: HU family DNA-binding protein [bacterium]|nr:HU family DNA-binding protein [bacterium]MDE0240119.1 HU family DNA-binding protein [bacterium]MDE0416406.1 HU family DNA-binding protein [bacterium]
MSQLATVAPSSLPHPGKRHGNNADIERRIAERLDLSGQAAGAAIECMLNMIGEALVHGEDIRLAGFGTVVVKDSPARAGRHPQTGETLSIPVSRRPSFKAGKAPRDAASGGGTALGSAAGGVSTPSAPGSSPANSAGAARLGRCALTVSSAIRTRSFATAPTTASSPARPRVDTTRARSRLASSSRSLAISAWSSASAAACAGSGSGSGLLPLCRIRHSGHGHRESQVLLSLAPMYPFRGIDTCRAPLRFL